MPTMRVCHFANEIGVKVETVIDALEVLQARNPQQKISRHQASNLTEEGQEAVREILAEGIVEARPDGKPELPADAPAVGAMRIVDFAEEVGQTVAVVCAELEALGEKSHHLSNIEPAAQDLLRCVFARSTQEEREHIPGARMPEVDASAYGPDAMALEYLEGPGEQILESDPDSPVRGELCEFDLTPGPAEAEAVDSDEEFRAAVGAVIASDADLETRRAQTRELVEQKVALEAAHRARKEAADAQLLANVDAFLEIHETTTAEAFAADPEGAETMPQGDRFALVTPQGQPTGEYECLSPDHAAIVRERIGDRKLMGLTLNLDRKFLVFVTWPDGQKYEVPV